VYKTKINVKPRPKINISSLSPATVCQKDDLLLIANTDAESIDWSGPNGFYSKNSRQLIITLNNVDIKNQGYYKAVAYSSQGCVDSSEHLVIVNPKPNSNFTFGKRCSDLITDDIIGFYSQAGSLGKKYEWFLNNAPVSDSTNYRKKFETAGSYLLKLKITTSGGCQSESEKLVVIDDAPKVFVPTAFTPNNDFLNTWFKPVTTRTVKRYAMSIYDRWGAKIFEWEGDNNTNDPKAGAWDGKVKGLMQPMGVYIVIIKYTTICDIDPLQYENEYKGTVLLLR